MREHPCEAAEDLLCCPASLQEQHPVHPWFGWTRFVQIVRVLAADAIDNTAKQSWQKLIDRKVGGGFRALLSARDQFEFDCMLHALLHRELLPVAWDVLCARYSTHNGRRLQAVSRMPARISSPAPRVFLTYAVSSWCIPKLKGKDGKRSTDVLVLSDKWYDINEWDTEARPDSTRSRWR